MHFLNGSEYYNDEVNKPRRNISFANSNNEVQDPVNQIQNPLPFKQLKPPPLPGISANAYHEYVFEQVANLHNIQLNIQKLSNPSSNVNSSENKDNLGSH